MPVEFFIIFNRRYRLLEIILLVFSLYVSISLLTYRLSNWFPQEYFNKKHKRSIQSLKELRANVSVMLELTSLCQISHT